jgi:hypothetical protein
VATRACSASQSAAVALRLPLQIRHLLHPGLQLGGLDGRLLVLAALVQLGQQSFGVLLRRAGQRLQQCGSLGLGRRHGGHTWLQQTQLGMGAAVIAGQQGQKARGLAA